MTIYKQTIMTIYGLQNTFILNMETGNCIQWSNDCCTCKPIELHLSEEHCCADWEFKVSSMSHHGSPLLMTTTSGLKSLNESAEEEQINQDIRSLASFSAATHVALAHMLWCRCPKHVLQQLGAGKYSIMCLVCDGASSLSRYCLSVQIA